MLVPGPGILALDAGPGGSRAPDVDELVELTTSATDTPEPAAAAAEVAAAAVAPAELPAGPARPDAALWFSA